MSSPLRFRSSASSILTSPHPLPFVGAVCLLSFGLSNLHSSLSSSTAAGGSLPVLRSRSVQARSKTEAAASSTVPSIVVYVTVPNKEAGKKLAKSIVKERLAACVNRVPGVESVYEWKGELFGFSWWHIRLGSKPTRRNCLSSRPGNLFWAL